MKYQCKSEMPLRGGLEIASLFSEGAQLHSAPCPIEIMMCHPCKNKTSGWTSVSQQNTNCASQSAKISVRQLVSKANQSVCQ